MSAAAVIDSLEFARGQQQLRGSLPVESLQRLEDVPRGLVNAWRRDFKGQSQPLEEAAAILRGRSENEHRMSSWLDVLSACQI